jgi:hypothetical protein
LLVVALLSVVGMGGGPFVTLALRPFPLAYYLAGKFLQPPPVQQRWAGEGHGEGQQGVREAAFALVHGDRVVAPLRKYSGGSVA